MSKHFWIYVSFHGFTGSGELLYGHLPFNVKIFGSCSIIHMIFISSLYGSKVSIKERSDCIFSNSGLIIDQDALVTALRGKQVRAAALDVTYVDPVDMVEGVCNGFLPYTRFLGFLEFSGYHQWQQESQ